MSTAIICFTAEGLRTARKIREVLLGDGDVSLCMKKEGAAEEPGVTMVQGSVRSWAGEIFTKVDALIFVGATGIAVRSIAPYIVSKTKDPAVVVVDERGTFAISLLSGHLGGANELTDLIAAGIGAASVITTATDRNHLFAVDVFARENSLTIDDMKIAKEISAALLDRRAVGFSSDFPLHGDVPRELTPAQAPGLETNTAVNTSNTSCSALPAGTDMNPSDDRFPVPGIAVCERLDECPFEKTLHLIPRAYVLGVGCRRNKDPQEMEEFLLRFLKQNGVPAGAVVKIASIDVKNDERAILDFSEKYRIPAVFYSAEELKRAPGEFTASAFVQSRVGVDNVCARAAVLGASDGARLAVPKTAENGMTAALAIGKVELSF